jgi:hypothetical protein
MREEIHLGNEALARNDIETAKRYFQQLLDKGGTPTQERIAANRLREIHDRQEAATAPSPAKPRTRRKTAEKTKQDETDTHTFVRPPEKPLVIINKH